MRARAASISRSASPAESVRGSVRARRGSDSSAAGLSARAPSSCRCRKKLARRRCGGRSSCRRARRRGAVRGSARAPRRVASPSGCRGSPPAVRGRAGRPRPFAAHASPRAGRESPLELTRSRVGTVVDAAEALARRRGCRSAWSRARQWPSSSWIVRRSAPPSSRCVANAWRRRCGCGTRRRSVEVSSRRPRAERNSAFSAPRASSGRASRR